MENLLEINRSYLFEDPEIAVTNTADANVDGLQISSGSGNVALFDASDFSVAVTPSVTVAKKGLDPASPVVFTIVVELKDTATEDMAKAVTITDTLPAAFTIVNANYKLGSETTENPITPAGQLITANVGDLYKTPAAEQYKSVTVTINTTV
jgi:hypothetical protein